MTKYINKAALVAEIERLKSIQLSIFSKGEAEESCYNALSCISVYNEVLSLLDTLEVKEVDLEKEATEFVQTKEFVESKESPVLLIAKYFFKLGLNSQTKDMIEALHTEYEKGRADVIADTLSWLENCWPKYCSNQTIIDGFKEAIKD